MPRTVAGPTKAELQDQLDSITEMLDEAYAPESTREDLAAAIGNALGVLNGEDAEEDDDED